MTRPRYMTKSSFLPMNHLDLNGIIFSLPVVNIWIKSPKMSTMFWNCVCSIQTICLGKLWVDMGILIKKYLAPLYIRSLLLLWYIKRQRVIFRTFCSLFLRCNNMAFLRGSGRSCYLHWHLLILICLKRCLEQTQEESHISHFENPETGMFISLKVRELKKNCKRLVYTDWYQMFQLF